MICPRCGVQRHGAPGAFGDCNCSFMTPVSTPIEFIDGPIPVSPVLPPMAANMTLREWYAGMAMQGLLAGTATNNGHVIVTDAYALAAAMMAEREKK